MISLSNPSASRTTNLTPPIGGPTLNRMADPPLVPSLQSHLWITALYSSTVFLASFYTSLITPEDNYFSFKRNRFNTVFVKHGWFWTTMVFIYHTSRLRATQPLRAVLRWALATAWWVLVTQWCFGPPIMDRTFLFTGGLCELSNYPGVDQGQLTTGELLVSSAACKLAKGNWKGGHDLSGHVFMLTHASLFLLSESMPIYHLGTARDWNHRASWAVIGLLSLWWWMLVMTGVHFHTWWEKVVRYQYLNYGFLN